MNIRFTLNGRALSVATAPDRRVIDLLREEFGLTGTKEGCGSGECGACTILADGENRLACLMLAAQLEGKTVTTIEGLAEGETLHPLQEAFVRCGAVQCGFCSPGMILSASALLKGKPAPTRVEIREGLSGNLCRCTGYQKIVDAVELAADLQNPGACPRDAGQDGHATGRLPSSAVEPGKRNTGDEDAPGRRLPVQRKDLHPVDPPGAGSSRARVLLPRSLPELWSLLEREPETALFAGGTDLLVRMRACRREVPVLIGLERIPELQEIREEGDCLWIGAGATHSRLLKDRQIRQSLPVLAKALETLGSPQVRHMGTIGGNICTASPAGDTLPPLYVLKAEVELRTGKTRRTLPIGSFIKGPGKTRLEPGEVLTGIRVQKPLAYNLHHFEKIGQRKALACALASLAALIRISPAGVIEDVRLAWGSVGPTIVTAAKIEELLRGERLSPALGEKAAAMARQAVSPIDDIRATAEYRRVVSGNLLLRLAAHPLPDHPS